MSVLETEIEKALDYRGDVTLRLKDGSSVEGYLFNRNSKGSARCPEPFVEIMVKDEPQPKRIAYAAIQSVALTGENTAAGRSWEEWAAKEAARKKAKPEGR